MPASCGRVGVVRDTGFSGLRRQGGWHCQGSQAHRHTGCRCEGSPLPCGARAGLPTCAHNTLFRRSRLADRQGSRSAVPEAVQADETPGCMPISGLAGFHRRAVRQPFCDGSREQASRSRLQPEPAAEADPFLVRRRSPVLGDRGSRFRQQALIQRSVFFTFRYTEVGLCGHIANRVPYAASPA